MGIKGCGLPVNTRKEPPPGLRGAYWPLEGAVQLAQALGAPFSARSIRPRYSLAALCWSAPAFQQLGGAQRIHHGVQRMSGMYAAEVPRKWAEQLASAVTIPT